jgi:hypothetical protein
VIRLAHSGMCGIWGDGEFLMGEDLLECEALSIATLLGCGPWVWSIHMYPTSVWGGAITYYASSSKMFMIHATW